MATDKHPALLALGARIRALRASSKISQENFAATVGLDRSYYSAVERGERNVTVLKLVLIANALNVELADLFPKVDVEKGTIDQQSQLAVAET